MQILLGIIIGIVLFQVNHRIKRMTEIKMMVNTLFEIYGKEFPPSEDWRNKSVEILHNHVITLEQMHDGNTIVKEQINKVRELASAYEKRDSSLLSSIGFKRLNGGFLLLAFFNIKL